MASLSHHLSSLFLFAILLSTSTSGNTVKTSSATCPLFTCCNSHVIGYPFWQLGQQNDHCGYPGFGLSCTGAQPLLRLSHNLYHLKNINYSEKTLTATYRDLNNVTCPLASHDVRINTSSSFNFTIENKMVRFFYNCTLYPPSLPFIACLQFGLKRSYVFVEGAIPEFDWEKYCESTVSVPVVERGSNGILVGGFVRFLQGGFKLTWRSPDSTCQSCEASGGFCGYGNIGLHRRFICYCSDGQKPNNCRDNGAVKLASQPNFVAIGALICGGLIIASTVFYFIQKKKPSFSRIPSIGK